MQRNYNYIYSRLVENEFDVVGHIAYSIYKKQKIEYIEKQKELGQEPTDSDLIPFNTLSSSNTSIETYRMKAELIVQGMIDNVMEEAIADIEEQAVKKQANILSEIIKPFEPKFWHNVGAGIVSALIFAGLIAIITIIIQTKGSVIKVQIEQPATEQIN